MFHTKDSRDRRPVTRRSFMMSLAVSASMLTALFVNIAATGGAPLNAMPHSHSVTLG